MNTIVETQKKESAKLQVTLYSPAEKVDNHQKMLEKDKEVLDKLEATAGTLIVCVSSIS